MEKTKSTPIAIKYRRGFLLYGACLPLGVIAVFTFGFIVLTAQVVREEPGVIIGLWSLLIAFTLVVAAITVPLIERFARNAPAIVVSSQGIRTRDMDTLMAWDDIEKMTTSSVTSWAGKYTTTVNVLEIHPKDPSPPSFGWRRLLDAHANPLLIAWHVLDSPERLKEALNAHAPPALLEESNLTGLPGAGQSN